MKTGRTMLKVETGNQRHFNEAEKWSGSDSGGKGTSFYAWAEDVQSREQLSRQHSFRKGPGGDGVLHAQAESAMSCFHETGRCHHGMYK